MGLFVTIRFLPQNLAMARKKLLQFSNAFPLIPLLAVFEQKGASHQSMGASPHIHLLTLGRHTGVVSKISTLFSAFDTHAEEVDPHRSADLAIRFLLKMNKKGRTQAEKMTTRKWRVANALTMVTKNNFMEKLRQGVTDSQWKKISSM